MVGGKTYKGKQLSGKIYESKQLKNSKQVQFRSTLSLPLSSRSRALCLLRPSSKSPRCTRYQIGLRRGALISSLDRGLNESFAVALGP